MKKLLILLLLFICQVSIAQRHDRDRDRHSKDHHHHTDHDHDDHYDDGYHPYDHDDLYSNDYKNAMYWYLIPLYYSTFQVGYERIKTTEEFRRQGILYSLGIILSSNRRSNRNGVIGEIQYRFYFDQANHQLDLFGGPYAQIEKVKVENEELATLDDILSLAGGLGFGAKLYVFNQGIIEVQLGGGVRYSNVPEERKEYYKDAKPWDFGYTGVLARGSVSIGFAF